MQFALAAGIPGPEPRMRHGKVFMGRGGQALTARTAQPFRPEFPRRKLWDRFQKSYGCWSCKEVRLCSKVCIL